MTKITTVITGARQVIQSFKMLDAGTRIRVRSAIQETTLAVENRARTNVPMSGAASRKAQGRPGPGELRDTIRSAFSTTGLAGYVMAGFGKLPRASKAKRPTRLGPLRLAAFQRQQKRLALKAQRELGVYAMVVNYGSPGRGIPGSRFMDRARESERTNHIARITRALSQAAAAAERGSI